MWYPQKIIDIENRFLSRVHFHLDKLLAELLSQPKTFKFSYADYQKRVSDAIDEAFDNISADMLEYEQEAYEGGVEHASKTTKGLIKAGLTPADMIAIEAIHQNNLALVKSVAEDSKRELLAIFDKGIREGWSIPDFQKEIQSTFNKIPKFRAETIARTELSRAYNKAASQRYQQAGIRKWQWEAAIGACPDCMDKDGVTYEFGEPEPPAHPNCKCTIIPVI